MRTKDAAFEQFKKIWKKSRALHERRNRITDRIVNLTNERAGIDQELLVMTNEFAQGLFSLKSGSMAGPVKIRRAIEGLERKPIWLEVQQILMAGGGTMKARDVIKAVKGRGLRISTQAVYWNLGRHPDKFRKINRGEYELVKETTGA